MLFRFPLSFVLFFSTILIARDVPFLDRDHTNFTGVGKLVACLRGDELQLHVCQSGTALKDIYCGSASCALKSRVSQSDFLSALSSLPSGPYAKTKNGLRDLQDAISLTTEEGKLKEYKLWEQNLKAALELQADLAKQNHGDADQTVFIETTQQYKLVMTVFEKAEKARLAAEAEANRQAEEARQRQAEYWRQQTQKEQIRAEREKCLNDAFSREQTCDSRCTSAQWDCMSPCGRISGDGYGQCLDQCEHSANVCGDNCSNTYKSESVYCPADPGF